MLATKVIEAIKAFEDQEKTLDQTKNVIFELTGKKVERHELENYWRGESLNDFVEKLTTSEISDWKSIDEEEALQLITEAMIEPGESIFLRNTEALEKRYQKSSGFISDLVFYNDLKTPSKILAELKKDTVVKL